MTNTVLYVLYHTYPGAHPPIFLFPVNFFEAGSVTFVTISLSQFASNAISLYLVNRKPSPYRIVVGEALVVLNFTVSSLLIPLSLTLILAYMEACGLYFLVTYIRLLDPFSTERIDAYPKDKAVEALKLLHSEWLELLRLSVGVAFTVVLGGLSAAIALLSSTGVMRKGGTMLWGYPMGQIALIGTLMMIGVLGTGLGVTMYCHNVLREIRRRIITASSVS